MDNKTIYRCKKTIRAAFAQLISKRQDFPLADANLAKHGHLVGQPHLTMVKYGTLGYPVADSLLPIKKMLQGDHTRAEHITHLDELMDDTNADFHDRILNISPPFQHEISLNFNASILNQVYEDMLRTSSFAGHVLIDDDELQQVRQFLYPTDQQGITTKSSAYLLYEQYDNQITELNLALNNARVADDSQHIEHLNLKILRLTTEWHYVGQKNKIEKMISIAIAGDKNASFEDERLNYLAILAARKQGRLTSALEFAKVKIHPLSPLINPEDHHGWTDIILNKRELLDALTPQIKQLFKVTNNDINHIKENITKAKFSYVVVMLNREWLCLDFLNAKYWRANKQMSDGKGGGLAPTVATYAIFVKEAAFFCDSDLIVQTPPIPVKQTNTPKVTQVTTNGVAKLFNFFKTTFKINHTVSPMAAATKKITIQGEIKLPPSVTIDAIRLELSLFEHSKLLEKRAISFLEIEPQLIHFTVNISSRFIHNKSGQPLGHQIVKIRTLSRILLQLNNADGTVLINKEFEFINENNNESISWQIEKPALKQVNMSTKKSPLLMAYAIEVLPKSPDPSAHFF